MFSPKTTTGVTSGFQTKLNWNTHYGNESCCIIPWVCSSM